MKITNTITNSTQRGVTLIVTLVILLVLTMLGLASMSDNRLQSAMVRNNQFQLEAFNASYSEINAQIDYLNNRSVGDGMAPLIYKFVVNGDVGDQVLSPDGLALMTPTTDMTQIVAQEYQASCILPGYTLGSVVCAEFRIDSAARLTNTRIDSNQFQTYLYIYLQ